MNPAKNSGVIIIGAGPSSIFCTYELIQKKPDMKILMVGKGCLIKKRACPKCATEICVGCKPCFITTGFVGVGAFSDGKLPLLPDVDGNLLEVLGCDKITELLKKSDNIHLKFDAGTSVYDLDKRKEIEEIHRKVTNANLKLIEHLIHHLETEKGYRVYIRLQGHLLTQGVTIGSDTMVRDAIMEEDRVEGILVDKDETCCAPEIVSVIDCEGSDWFPHICGDHEAETQVSAVGIGVHMEVRDEAMKFLDDNLYEAKLVYYAPISDGGVHAFCTDSSNEVATEYHKDDLAVINGHAYKSKEYKTDNINLALLASKNFTKPFSESIEHDKYTAQFPNVFHDGRIMVQAFGDSQRGRRTTEERLCRNNLVPTLKDTVPGDLSLVSPHRIMTDIKEMLLALDKVTPGIASDETLLHDVEVKFYSNKVVVNTDFETSIRGFRAIDDGASVIRGLQQASTNGISVVRSILKQMGA